jgi:hypothetical protein
MPIGNGLLAKKFMPTIIMKENQVTPPPSLRFWDFFPVSDYESKAGSSNYTDLQFKFPSGAKLLNPVPSRVYGPGSLPDGSNPPSRIPGQHWSGLYKEQPSLLVFSSCILAPNTKEGTSKEKK